MFKPMLAAGVALLGISLLSGAQAQSAPAQSAPAAQEIFRVGSFDRSSLGFAPGEPARPVTFVAGHGDAARDWFANQPAVLRSPTGKSRVDAATAPRTIVFSVQGKPQGLYRLHVSLLLETASVPALRAAINGRQGLFYLHPRLDSSNGDQGDSFYAAYSHATVSFTFPASYLKTGRNTLSLQAVEQAREAVPGAGFTYDAIALDHLSGRGNGAALEPSAQIVPTIFFVHGSAARGPEALEERVNVFLRSTQGFRAGSTVELRIGGASYRQTVAENEDMGEEKIGFLVPEFSPAASARVTWKSGGRSRSSEQSISPQKQWTIFVVPENHTDVGYSDYQAKVSAIQARDIDEALRMIHANPAFRYSLDGEWDLQQFLATRSPADRERALQAIKAHKLFVPAQYANLLTGFPTAETLIRSLYPSAKFARRHHTPFNYANLTDVPSYSWSYASILAAAGIHDLAGGSNNYRAPVLLQGHLNEDSPFWWEGPDGSKVLLWYSRHYEQMQMMFGLPPLPDAGRDTLPLFLQMYEHPGFVGDETILYGTQVENTDLFPQQSQFVAQWNRIYAYPHLEYSGFHHALQSIQQQFGTHIPTIRGDGGPYWEDGIASDARYAAIERWNEGRAPAAETLATLTSIVNPHLRAGTKALDRMWRNMVLMDEHTFDSFNSVSQPKSVEAKAQLRVKNEHALAARAATAAISRNSMASLASAIPAAAGSVIVFNSLGWKRSGLVALDLGNKSELIDTATGQPVPVAVLFHGRGFDHVQFLATDVPPAGYKVYDVRPSKNPSPAPDEISGTTMENSFYRITLDPATGAVKSIYDKQLQRELVNANSPYRFGQYLYVSGGDKAPNTLLQYSLVYPKPHLTVHPAAGGRLLSIARTPYGEVATMRSRDTNTPSITSEILLFHGSKKIEFIEKVDKKAVETKEGVYFAFPFAMSHPEFQYEIQNGVVNPATDMYPGAGHVWFSVQHWVALQQNGLSAGLLPLDAGLVTFGDINRGQWPKDFGTRRGTVFSYVMNNYWDTNYRASQGGDFTFHYVVTSSAATDAPALSRLGWEQITPLTVDTVTTQDRAIPPPQKQPSASGACALDPHQGSFLDVSDPDVLFDTWKPAEDGDGTILRFLNLSGKARTVSVQIPLLDIAQAWRTSAVENNERKLTPSGEHSFEFHVRPHGIATFRVEGSDVCQDR